MDLELKKELYQKCIDYVEEKLTNEIDAMENAQKSANEETKSGMGDKYETNRSMIQIEKQKYEIQVSESLKLKKFLEQIDINKKYNQPQPGAIVETDDGNYFIAINVGSFEIKNKKYFTISLASPIGQSLANKNINDIVAFRNKTSKILNVY